MVAHKMRTIQRPNRIKGKKNPDGRPIGAEPLPKAKPLSKGGGDLHNLLPREGTNRLRCRHGRYGATPVLPAAVTAASEILITLQVGRCCLVFTSRTHYLPPQPHQDSNSGA